MKCVFCDSPITVGRNARKPRHCLECGESRSAEAIRQMSAKSGPYYEKWISAMVQAVEEIQRATPGG